MTKTIMVVDDNQTLGQFFIETLTDEGYEVISADSRENAISITEKNPPDLILIHIPGLNMQGSDIIKALNKHKDRIPIPIILLISTSARGLHHEEFQTDFDDFIIKPFHKGELLTKVRAQLDLFSLRHQIRKLSEDLENSQKDLQEEKAKRKQAEERLQESRDFY